MFAPTTLAQTFSSSRAFTSAGPVAKPHGDRRLYRVAATISATSSASPSATASSTALAKNGDSSLAPAVSSVASLALIIAGFVALKLVLRRGTSSYVLR
jgi:hypothetical protein